MPGPPDAFRPLRRGPALPCGATAR